MKRILSFLLILITIMALEGCSKNKNDIVSETSIELTEMLSFKSADIRMADDFSEILCTDKRMANYLIFGKLKSGEYAGYLTNTEFTEKIFFEFSKQDGETIRSAALMQFGESAVLTTLKNDTYIYVFDNNGGLEKTLELGEVISADDNYVQLLCYENGFYINIERSTLAYIDIEGNYKGNVNCNGRNICGIINDNDNKPCVLMSEGCKMSLGILSECSITEETKIGELADYTNAICTGVNDYRIAVVVTDGLYGLKDNIWVKLTDFSENDFYTNMIVDIDMIDNESFSVTLIGNDASNEMRLLSKRDISEIKAKKIIKMANVVIGDDPYNDLIKKYNSESDEYKVEIVNYASSSNFDDGLSRLKLDIISGSAPDIIIFDSLAPVESYGSGGGAFVDMYELIDKDPDIERNVFIEGFLEGIETNGKLLQLSSNFSIKTLMIKDKYVNGLESWNIDELQTVYNNKPNDMLFSISATRHTKADMMDTLVNYTQFYNKTTAEGYFDSPEFIKAMKFIKDNNIGISNNELEYRSEGSSYLDGLISFRNDRVLIQDVTFFDFTNLREYQQVYADDTGVFIGFPSLDRINAVSYISNKYGIMANSDNIEGAWDFLKYYLLSDDSFNDISNHYIFSGIEKNYKEQLDYFCTSRTVIDSETGEEKNADIYTYFAPESIEPTIIELHPFTNEEAKKYDNFIRNALKHPANYDDNIQNIVREEVTAFFEGERSAEDAAEIIQNRVTIYLSEQS